MRQAGVMSMIFLSIGAKQYMQPSHLMTWRRNTPRTFPFGPSIYPVLASLALTEIPAILLTYRTIMLALPLPLICSVILLQVVTAMGMALCVCVDPGIIPQILPKHDYDLELFRTPTPPPRGDQERKYLITNLNLLAYQKYCPECAIHRPIRSIHCNSCQHCVQRYDHHCPWLNVCIGKFNYKYYLLYISSLCLLCGTVAATSLYIVTTAALAGQYFTTFLLETCVALVAAVFFIPLLQLTFYHFIIIWRRHTTNEQMREIYVKVEREIPFGHAYCLKRQPLSQLAQSYFLKETDLPAKRELAEKGDRYCTLLADRKSVFTNLLDQAEL